MVVGLNRKGSVWSENIDQRKEGGKRKGKGKRERDTAVNIPDHLSVRLHTHMRKMDALNGVVQGWRHKK